MSAQSDHTVTYQVSGMTCDHCANAVSGEVRGISGVVDVLVDVPMGAVTVTSKAPLDPDSVRAAIAEAGYQLV